MINKLQICVYVAGYRQTADFNSQINSRRSSVQMCTLHGFLLPPYSLKSQKIPLIKSIPLCTHSLPRPKGWLLLFLKYGQPEKRSFARGWEVANTRSCILEGSRSRVGNNIRNPLTKGVVLILACGALLGNEYISLL